jgi:T1SS-143 domain-containing protein
MSLPAAYSHSTTEDTPVSGQVVASDADGNPLSYTAGTAPAHGSVTVNPDGTWTYTPGSNFNGSDSFTVTISDGQGGISIATVNVGVTAVNDAPVANNDSLSTTEDTAVTYTAAQLLGNDTDIDSATLSIASVASGSGGSAVLNADGSVTFTPNAHFNGTADFSYIVTDGTSNSTPATATVQVAAINDAPVASADSASVLEGGSVVINLVSNDGDVEGALDPASIVITSAPTHGTVSVNANGTVSYQHDGSETAADSFSYTVKDAQGLVSAPVNVSIAVTGSNDLPVVDTGSANFDPVTGSYQHSTTEDTPVSGQVVASDADGNPLSYTAGTAPAHGSVTINPDGTWTYTPGSNFNGTDVFTVTISDGQGGISTATVNVGVTAVNDAPVASADSASVLEGGSVVINLVSNDGDVEGALDPASIVITSAPTHGTVSVNANGTVSYQHNGSETAADSFSYTVKDAQGLVSAPVNVSVSVTGVNDLPVVDTGSANFDVATGAYSHSTNEDTPVSGQVVASDADGNPLSYTAGTSPAHGSVTVNPDGTWTYTPGSNFNGTDVFTVTISDGQGGISTATVNVGVTAVNDAPVANNDSLSTTEDTAVTYTAAQLLGNDTDIDSATLSIASVASGSGGSAVLNADGSVTFTPNAHFNGTADFSYIVTDGTSNSTPATATVQVAAINDAPVANNDSLSTTEDTAVTYTAAQLLGNDTDIDSATLSIASVASGSGGSAVLNADGSVTFTPNAHFNGTADFSYIVTDGTSNSTPATATVQVAAINDAPVASADSASVLEGGSVVINLVSNDGDVEGALDPASIVITNAPTHGTVSVNANGTVSYQHDGSETAADSFSYTVKDAQGLVSAPVSVSVSVTGVNDLPVVDTGSANFDVATGAYSHSTTEDTPVSGQVVASDADGNPLSYTAGTAPAHGSVTVNPDGTWTYTPGSNFNGTDVFTVTISDGQGGISTATVNVGVTAVNDAPVASADSASVLEGGSVVINLVGNDGDVEGSVDPASIVITSAPTHGTVSVNANGTVSYQHDGSETAADSFSYTVKDAQGLVSAPVSVSVSVTGANDLPVVDTGSANFDVATGAYSHSTTEDTPVSGQVVASDADGNPLSYTAGTAPAHGSVTVNPDGTWTYTPGSNFNGSDSFTVAISDGQGGISTATVNVGVTAVNDAPVTSADSASVLEGGSVVINLVSNDGDVEGALDPASIVITSAPTHGTVSVNANGTVSYQHNGSETAADSFSYTVKDAQGLVSAPVSVSVSVTGVNDLPVVDTGSANFDVATGAYSHSTTEDTPVSGQVVASDADGNPLSYTAGTAPAHGSVTVNPDGTWTYTPGSNFNGTDVFTVTISDGQGGISTATVNVGVTAVNDAPVASADSASVLEGGSVVINLVSNDGDVEGALDPASIVITSAPTHGTVSVNANGTVSYQHDGSETAADSFSYTVKDAQGLVSAPVSVSVSVTGANDLPVVDTGSANFDVATGAYSHSTNEDTPVSGQVVASDADGNPLSYTAGTAPAHGSVTVNPDGTWTYTPGSNFNGSDSFTVAISDGQGGISIATVNVGVTAVNDAPVANNDSLSTTEDTAVTYTAAQLLGNDTDIDSATLSIASVASGSGGSAVLNADGSVTFTPNAHFNGTADFSYIVTDGTSNSTPATATVQVAAINDAPVASADSASVLEGGSVVINLVSNDGDVEGALDPASIVITSAPTHGTVSVNANGTVSYQHDGSETAADSFSYTVKDAQGLVSAPVNVSIAVTGSNDLPVVDTGSANFDPVTGSYQHSTTEDTPVSGQVVASDADGNPLSYTAGTAPAHGSVTINPDGTWTYTPGSNFNGTDVFTVTISDGQGGISTATVNVGVTAVNDVPVASADSASVLEGGSVVINLVSNDGDVEGALDPASIVITSAPTHGTVSVNANGTVSYQHNGSETAADSFSYTVKDAQGLVSAPVNVSVSVTGVNDLPVVDTGSANFDVATGAYSHSTNEDTPVSGQVVASDADGNPLSYTAGTSPAHGSVTVNPDGTWTYTPGSNFNGTDVFTVTISDGQGGISTATVNVGVTAVNDAPVANNDSLSTTEDTAVTYTAAQLLGNDTDIDSATLSIASVASGSGGSAVLNADGSVTFTPNAHFNGTADFSYIVTDGTSNSTPATATVQVAAINDAPVANNDSLSTTEDTAVTYTAAQLLGNDTDIDSATLSIASVASGSGGSAVLNADGSVTFTPNAHFNGTADFSYIVTDGTSNSTPATATVQVAAINDAPVASADSASVLEGGSVVINLVSNDGDVEGALDPASIVITNAPTHGTVSVNANGTVSYQHDGSETAADSFSYTVKDAQGLVSAPVSVSVSVTGVNDLPVVDTGSANFDVATGAYSHSTTEDTPVSGQVVASDADGNPLSYTAGTAPAHGSVTVNPDGTWTYTPGSNFNGTDVFTVTISDGQGGISTATVNVGIAAVNDAPTLGSASVALLEADLASAVSTQSGSLNTLDIDSATVTTRLALPTAALTSSGAAVTWSLSSDGHTLLGTADSSEVLRATIDNQGNYTVTLSKPIDHAVDQGQNLASFNIGISATDGIATTLGSLTVRITDDTPEANAAVHSLRIRTDTINVNDLDAGFIGDTYQNYSYFEVRRTDADSHDTFVDRLRWGDPVSNSLKSGYDLVDNVGFTSSTGTVITEGTAFKLGDFTHSNYAIYGGSSTLSYTDVTIRMDVTINGVSTPVAFSVRLNHTETPNSADAVASRDIITLPAQTVSVQIAGQSYTVSLLGFQDKSGNIVNTIYTDEGTNNNTFGIYAQVSSVQTPVQTSGELLNQAGADGAYLSEVIIDGTRYGYNPTSGITVTSGTDHGNFSAADQTLTVQTGLGGVFVIDMDDGNYTYTASTNVTSSASDVLAYTVRDVDGDTASATVVVNVAPPTTVTLSNTGIPYQGNADPENILGSSGNDTIYGDGGSDHISGNGGNDTIHGGQGSDLLGGGAGSDVFAWSFNDQGTPGDAYHDVITDFNTASRLAGGDVLDLRDLLQGELHLGTNSGNLGNFLQFENVGGNTLLHISSTGAYNSGYAATKDDQTITLQGVDLSNNNTLSNSQIIQNLLAGGKLITD